MLKTRLQRVGLLFVSCLIWFCSCDSIKNTPAEIPPRSIRPTELINSGTAELKNALAEGELNRQGAIQLISQLENKQWFTDTDSIFSLALAQFPSEESILLYATQFYLEKGQLKKAALYHEQAFQVGASNAKYYHLASGLKIARGELDAAIDDLNKAILLNPGNHDFYLTKGLLYQKLNDSQSALNAIEKAYSINPNDEEVFQELAKLYRSTGQDSLYLELLGTKVENNPIDPYVTNYTKALVNVGAYQTAKTFIKNAINLDSSKWVSWSTLLSEAYITEGHKDSAVYLAKNMLEVDSALYFPNIVLGRIYNDWGYFNASINYYSQAIKIDSTNQIAVDELNNVYQKIAYLRKIRSQQQADTLTN